MVHLPVCLKKQINSVPPSVGLPARTGMDMSVSEGQWPDHTSVHINVLELLGLDNFSHSPWPRMLLYAFPPVLWLLDQVQVEHLPLILLKPDLSDAVWFPILKQLVYPWQLLWKEDVLP
ncbi:hypothetical protein ILYODFUR_024750 [Ilyodon furcidens]|uniref:Uncharacterized protein n=1 Tax=Ilyodon furcidens TaxID=33524 RepID=A0ABV0TMJ9_9TELE